MATRAPEVNAPQILAVLRTWHAQERNGGTPRWVFFEELRVGPGFMPDSLGRMDAWAMDCWESRGFSKRAYEVKTYRGDLVNELKRPEKRRFALEYSNQFYFATPPGLFRPGELPPECGLIEIGADLRYREIVKAPLRPDSPANWAFFAVVARRAMATERLSAEAKP